MSTRSENLILAALFASGFIFAIVVGEAGAQSMQGQNGADLRLRVQAQPYCAARSKIVNQLKKKYHEHRVFMGMSGGSMVEWFANPETGSWTAINTSPTGTSCTLAAGQYFSLMPQPKPVARGERS